MGTPDVFERRDCQNVEVDGEMDKRTERGVACVRRTGYHFPPRSSGLSVRKLQESGQPMKPPHTIGCTSTTGRRSEGPSIRTAGLIYMRLETWAERRTWLPLPSKKVSAISRLSDTIVDQSIIS